MTPHEEFSEMVRRQRAEYHHEMSMRIRGRAYLLAVLRLLPEMQKFGSSPEFVTASIDEWAAWFEDRIVNGRPQ